MNEDRFNYSKTRHPLTNDIMWKIEDISLALGGVSSLINTFISQYPKQNYSLSIFDINTSKTIEISCDIAEIPQIVEYIYQTEKGTPLSFIGVNSLSESYVVGMSISRGRIDFGSYKAIDGKLERY